jgi:hypothetical protein
MPPIPNTSIRIDPEQRLVLNQFLRICRERPDDLGFVSAVLEALLRGARVNASVEEPEV